MSEFYKMAPLQWDRGTDDLTLEQEAAYLRVCNAIYAADQPIRENYRMLAGMWRCNERRAKRLLAELINAGKLVIKDGWIINERAVNDVSTRRELRMERQLAGRSGGIESGKSRANILKDNDTGEAIGSTRREEKRGEAEEKEPPLGVPPQAFEAFWTLYPRKVGKDAARKAWANAARRASIDDIVAGLRGFVEVARNADRQFIAHPATWLNEGRWQDEQSHARNGPRTSTDDLTGLANIRGPTPAEDLAHLMATPFKAIAR